jgi:hypothetical protein
MTVTDRIVKSIVTRVIKSQDYRIEVVNLINAEFLQFALDFFKKIVNAKFNSENISIDWYRNAFMDADLPSGDIAINSGLNKKTISNMYGTATKTIVIEAANEHFESLYKNIQTLVEMEKEIDLTLTIKMIGISVDLNISESLIVINTLAVKRAALRGGLWSTAGKRAEKYLMLTLCNLYKVDGKYYDSSHFIKDKTKKVDREVDFYLCNNGNKYRCEVKLMGQGNPESADAIFARKPHVFVADKLSQQNINQSEQLGVNWVELRRKDGYRRFKFALEKLEIPHTDYRGNLDNDLPLILESLFIEHSI